MNTFEIAQRAASLHRDTNHLYDGKDYSVHLGLVVHIAEQYLEDIEEGDRDTVIAACWLHDTIEDCRQTYNDIKEIAGKEVTDIVYACTNEKGKTRKERANDKYYEGIRTTKYATFVKMCDRLANISYSRKTGSRMYEMYQKEQKHFLESLQPYTKECLNLVKEFELQ